MNKKHGIVVVGSTNVDLVARVAHLPLPGETVGNTDYTTTYGGKGANQAIAAARAGGDVVFVTNLGDDSYGSALIPYFRDNAISSEFLFVEQNTPTGVAIILVADSGENCIAVAPGANQMLANDKIERIHAAIEQAEYLLLQMEIPYTSVASLIDYAYRAGTRIVLNPAPAMPLDPELLRKISLLILNETEAETISGLRLAEHDPAILAEQLHRMGPETIILTLGASGAYICSSTIRRSVQAFRVKAVDTTAAGDTFCGALTAQLTRTHDLLDAVKYATAAAALAVTKLGAQPSIPDRQAVEQFLETHCAPILEMIKKTGI